MCCMFYIKEEDRSVRRYVTPVIHAYFPRSRDPLIKFVQHHCWHIGQMDPTNREAVTIPFLWCHKHQVDQGVQ
jgi:hypothetical protein